MLKQLKEEANLKTTEKGAVAYKSTMNKCLDLFALGGAYRERTDEEVLKLFFDAYKEDKQSAIRLLFYLRDIRGGQGERRFFRVALRQLAIEDAITVKRVAHLIAEYGRYDDMLVFIGTPVENYAMTLIRKQLEEDVLAEFPTLLAKWLPSENASSKDTKRMARIVRTHLGYTPKQYRQTLSALRNKINIVETLMSQGRWSEIDYGKLPSKAGLQYRAAFYKHDLDRYSAFMMPKDASEVRVNAGTLYPYEILSRVMSKSNSYTGFFGDEIERATLNAYWNNLPDYLNGDPSKAIAVVDVSGSMCGRPMEVAISLGMYMAEKNTGVFANHFITFSKNPQLLEIKGADFVDKVCRMENADWGMNTNLKATFDLLLNTAKKNDLPQSEIPEMLYIISDMEFDRATGGSGDKEVLMKIIEDEWTEAGYKMPHIVFWNVNARNNTLPVMGVGNYSLVSGFSPSIFEMIIKKVSARDLMLNVINSERYSNIVI